MPHNNPIFSRYKDGIKCFVETGSYNGDGIQEALDSGFEKIISIEINDERIKICQKRFKEEKKVNIVKGDSAIILYDVIKDINEPMMFWLDAHFDFSGHHCPILKELDGIAKHQIKEHVILIDDLRDWRKDNQNTWQRGNPDTGFGRENILEKVHAINNRYKVLYENGHIKDDILVAWVMK